MSAANRGTKRRHLDHYPTPAWAIPPILARLPRGGSALDVGCGEGAILKAMIAAGWDVGSLSGVELDERRAYACEQETGATVDHCNFIVDGPWRPFDLVIGNPPFTHAEAFAMRSLEAVAERRGTVALLLRLSFLETAKRVAFNTAHPADVFVLSARPSFTGDGHSDSCAYAWFVWGPGRGNRWSILDVGDAKKSHSRGGR